MQPRRTWATLLALLVAAMLLNPLKAGAADDAVVVIIHKDNPHAIDRN